MSKCVVIRSCAVQLQPHHHPHLLIKITPGDMSKVSCCSAATPPQVPQDTLFSYKGNLLGTYAIRVMIGCLLSQATQAQDKRFETSVTLAFQHLVVLCDNNNKKATNNLYSCNTTLPLLSLRDLCHYLSELYSLARLLDKRVKQYKIK